MVIICDFSISYIVYRKDNLSKLARYTLNMDLHKNRFTNLDSHVFILMKQGCSNCTEYQNSCLPRLRELLYLKDVQLDLYEIGFDNIPMWLSNLSNGRMLPLIGICNNTVRDKEYIQADYNTYITYNNAITCDKVSDWILSNMILGIGHVCWCNSFVVNLSTRSLGLHTHQYQDY